MEQFNQQLEEQKLKVGQQEGELVAKRKELEELKGEESQLEAKLEACKKETEFTARNVGDTQLEISHIKTKLMELEEYDRRLNDGITELDVSISSKDIMKINNLLPRTITPPLIEAEQQNNGFSSNEFPSDPFAGEDPFKGSGKVKINFFLFTLFNFDCLQILFKVKELLLLIHLQIVKVSHSILLELEHFMHQHKYE